MKLIHILAAALLPVFSTAGATGLRITQVVDRPPQLLAFISPDDPVAAPSRGTAAPGTQQVQVGIDKVTWPAKAVETWSPRAPVAVVLAIDVSGSMRSVDFPVIRAVVANALAGLPPASQAALLTIGRGVQTKLRFGPLAQAADMLRSLEADEPETALNEAVTAAQRLAEHAVAGEGAPELPLRRFVLLVTDGADDSKKAIRTPEMMDEVAKGSVPVYAVAVTRSTPTPSQANDLGPFAAVIRASGGGFLQSVPARLGQDLTALIADALNTDQVTIDCEKCPRDGQPHTLQLTSSRPGETLTGERQILLFANPASGSVASQPASTPSDEPAARSKVTFDFDFKVKVASWIALLAALGGGAFGAVKYVEHRKHVVTLTSVTTHVIHAQGTKETPIRVSVDIAGVGRQQVSVDGDGVVLGRSASADISTPKDGEASSRHALLFVEKELLMLRDLDSNNGTYLNGVRIVNSEPIHDRDVVRIGRTDIRIFVGQL